MPVMESLRMCNGWMHETIQNILQSLVIIQTLKDLIGGEKKTNLFWIQNCNKLDIKKRNLDKMHLVTRKTYKITIPVGFIPLSLVNV